MNNSNITAQSIKEWLVRETKDSSIQDEDIIDGLNDFYTIVHQIERRVDPDKYRKLYPLSGSVSITSAGLDLSSIPDIANYREGFEVYSGVVSVSKYIRRVHPSSAQRGFCVTGDTLHLRNFADPTDIVLYYRSRGTRIAIGTSLATHTLQINQDLERSLRKYLKSTFFDGKYQFSLRNDAEDKAFEELERYFSDGSSSTAF